MNRGPPPNRNFGNGGALGGGPPPLGIGGDAGGAGLASLGGLGMFSIIAAMFSRGNASETFKLLFYGLLIELGRRIYSWITERIPLQPCVSARFVEGDPAYEWVMLYLTEENIWRKSRSFDVSAKTTKRKFAVSTAVYEGVARLTGASSADYVPQWGMPHVFRWRGHWVDATRSAAGGGHGGQETGQLKITILSFRMSVLTRFVEEMRERYAKSNQERVIIHLSDSNAMPFGRPPGQAEWGSIKTKVKRPLDSVALPDGVMSGLLEDVREFLALEDWYVRSGIPHHRGYLLHGPPGTGKSSTIYALAGELGIEIYSLSLAASNVDDAYLQRLASAVPRGAMLLVEDIDCAFPSRDDDGPGGRPAGPVITGTFMPGVPGLGARVTLSGLLNVIDGVGSDEGRLFFATTNHYDRLDPALIRPGRIDMKIEYTNASTAQARTLFHRFFPDDDFSPSPAATATDEKTSDSTLRNRKAPSPSLIPAHLRRPLTRPLAELANTFARAVPPGAFSTAELQGYLLRAKFDPERAADGAGAWVEREGREREERRRREEERRGEGVRREAEVRWAARGYGEWEGEGYGPPPPPGGAGYARGGSPGRARGRGHGRGGFGWGGPSSGRGDGDYGEMNGKAEHARTGSSSPELIAGDGSFLSQ